MAPEGLIGVGVDQLKNRVNIISNDDQSGGSPVAVTNKPIAGSEVDSQLATQFGSSALEFSSNVIPTATSGPDSDSAPWNGGDQIVSTTASPSDFGCTSGPGLHNVTTGDDLLLTAGHCAYGVINAESPPNSAEPEWYNSSTLVGGESVWAAGGSEASPSLDFGVLPTESSDQAWSSATALTTFYDYYLPPADSTVCEDGSYGGDQCGTEDDYNVTIEEALPVTGTDVWVEDTLQVGLTLSDGDSGGADWVTTVNGPYAVGTNVATGGGYSYMQEITPIVYVLSVYYGDSIDVNTAFAGCGGTSC